MIGTIGQIRYKNRLRTSAIKNAERKRGSVRIPTMSTGARGVHGTRLMPYRAIPMARAGQKLMVHRRGVVRKRMLVAARGSHPPGDVAR
jgi:hypothetical protein